MNTAAIGRQAAPPPPPAPAYDDEPDYDEDNRPVVSSGFRKACAALRAAIEIEERRDWSGDITIAAAADELESLVDLLTGVS